MEHHDRLKHCTETRTGPGPSPGPELSVRAVFSPADQILSTIDSDALLTTASPEEEGQEEEEEEEEEGEEEDDDDEGLRECKMKMKPHQELNSSSCVLLERQRRKRITQSCSTLRQLLPTIHSGRVDMVTVLETTVAFLETVQELVPAEDPKIQLCPPAELHADWLLQSQESREVGHKMAAEQEKKKKLNRSGDVLLQRKKRTSRRQVDRQADRQLPVCL